MIGRIIGNYQVTAELAHGGMGVVYRGQHLHLPREVVVKSILLSAFSPSAQAHLRARFRREAYIQSQLDHPNIVRVYEFFAAEDNYYLVMEYVQGLTLRDLLARQGLPTPAQAVYLCKQALSALDYAHNFSYVDESDIRHAGVIHRDVKPANLLLDTKGKLKVTDFGIVKVVGEQTGLGMTQSGFHPGTVEYMSPEQLLGLELDERSDLYSLGVTFYEMLTGRLPFERSSTGSDWEIRKGHIELDPPEILEIRPDVPPTLAAIIMRSLRKNPNERFQSATEFLEALQSYQQRNAGSEQPLRVQTGKLTRPQVIMSTQSEHTETLLSPAASLDTKPAGTPSAGGVVSTSNPQMEEAATLPLSPSKESFPVWSSVAPVGGPHSQSSELPTVVRVQSGTKRRWPLIASGAGLLLVGTAAGAILFSQKIDSQVRTPDLSTPLAVTSTVTPTPEVTPKQKPSTTAAETSLLRQAQQFEQEGKYLEAISSYEAYLRRNPNAPSSRLVEDSIVTLRQVQGLLTSADSAMVAHNYPLARRDYAEALKLRPDSTTAKNGLNEAETKLRQLPGNPLNGRLPRLGEGGAPRGPRQGLDNGPPPDAPPPFAEPEAIQKWAEQQQRFKEWQRRNREQKKSGSPTPTPAGAASPVQAKPVKPPQPPDS